MIAEIFENIRGKVWKLCTENIKSKKNNNNQNKNKNKATVSYKANFISCTVLTWNQLQRQ